MSRETVPPCPPDCFIRDRESGPCTCGHWHDDRGACEQRRCPCKAFSIDTSWQWHASHPGMREELDAGGDLHHVHGSVMWQLLVFDHDRRAERGESWAQLSEAQRVRLRELAEARAVRWHAPFDVWSSCYVPFEFVKDYGGEELATGGRERNPALLAGVVEAWLDQPLSADQWNAAAHTREASRKAAQAAQERQQAAQAVAAGTYTGKPQQAAFAL